MIVNNRGQIIGDDGISWLRDYKGLFSVEPRGYFIELLDGKWQLFRKTKSSYQPIPYVRQILTTGSIAQCMLIAEIYEIRRYK